MQRTRRQPTADSRERQVEEGRALRPAAPDSGAAEVELRAGLGRWVNEGGAGGDVIS
jgi:hypothetical protein